MNHHSDISYLGVTNARSPQRAFGIQQTDRLFHIYSLGKTGAGKTTLLETLAMQDILAGRGLAVIDPHGDLAARLVAQMPEHRNTDLIYLNVPDDSQPYGYNPLRRVSVANIPLAASGLMEALRMHWGEAAWGVRMEHVLRNSLYALLEYGEATLPDVLRMFTDTSFRHQVIKRVKNEQVSSYWTNEFANYSPRYRQEVIAPIQNKIGALLADPRLYRMFARPKVDLRFRHIMDEGKILIVNLAKGRIGADSADLAGALLMTTIGLAALSRADVNEFARRDFHVMVDEFQNFTTTSFANMISELRKFHVGLFLTHQNLHQLDNELRHAVLGNVGTLISFRIGPEDARIIEREFEPTFSANDLVNLPNWNVYLKLMIDGVPSKPFSATTLAPESIGGLIKT